MIGPIAEITTIPFMTTGRGVELIGLIFTITGILGFIVTLIAMRSRSYKLLAERYKKQ